MAYPSIFRSMSSVPDFYDIRVEYGVAYAARVCNSDVTQEV
jgi:hypothetical protein